MHCYICESSPKPFGTRYEVSNAVGICHQCSIGVCLKHSRRSSDAGAPLLCEECAGNQQGLTTRPKNKEDYPTMEGG
jgi:hypothetical protein